ncbi:uncharacterized protein LOC115977100 isoform X3 [Quercus lobata]|uniref:uncharacterized protein LOC115977100 isoform X3 n=1 Tax=Quercus lobata TaxID=97700 RepID=UPI00124639DD|nr:uncharacterized protein LOC115977100 isoform X3 [Quercus lobata]
MNRVILHACMQAGVQVGRKATIAELKEAVEEVFTGQFTPDGEISCFVFARYLSINRGQDKRPIKHRTAAYQHSTACGLVVEMISTLMLEGLLMDLAESFT